MRIACRCEAIEVEIGAGPQVQFYCHCDDCQALHGAAYVPESVYPADAVKITRGEPGRWTLRRNPRYFCPQCATRLFIDVLGLGVRGVSGSLLPAGDFRPTFHMQCRYAVRPVVDDLPHYLSRPARFGGSDEQADWPRSA